MTNNMKGAYGVTWVEMVPVKGIVTKHDRKMFGDIMLMGTETIHYKHFATKDDAINYLTNFNLKLDKQYICRMCCDKQFGYIKDNGRVRTRMNGEAIQFTSKQLKEIYTIG